MAALLWVAYTVVSGFHLGSTGQADYLGINFVINSGLLVLLAWLVPYVLFRLLQPSRLETTVQALHEGLGEALEMLREECSAAFDAVGEERKVLLEEGRKLLRDLTGERIPATDADNRALMRFTPGAAVRSGA
jgi:uncharacterized membrane protein YccC